MLEQIENIDWASLKHAYGSAGDVPSDIRNLTSHDEKIRDKALYNLYGNIFHQGTRYEATPYTISFLYELIENELVKDKHKIIALLVNLALGYEEEYLPEGISPEDFRNELIESEANMTNEERQDCEKYGYSSLALINCYDFVKGGIPILLKCLKSEDKKIREAALYAISWFPEEAGNSIPQIIDLLSQAKCEIEIANAVLSIGLLIKQSKENFDISPLNYYVKSDSELVKICSAIALAKNPIDKKIMEILIEGIKLGEDLNYVEKILFNEGRISGYASSTLSKYGKTEKEKIIPVLCQVLKSVNPYQSLNITATIIELINENRKIPITETKLEDLERIDVYALTSIAESSGWEGFGNYSLMMSDSGMPNSKEKLLKYLNKKP